MALTGPSRAVGMNEPVTIEAELKVKGAVKSKDRYFILEAKAVPLDWGSRDVEFTGTRGSRLKIALGELHNCVEAIIFLSHWWYMAGWFAGSFCCLYRRVTQQERLTHCVRR